MRFRLGRRHAAPGYRPACRGRGFRRAGAGVVAAALLTWCCGPSRTSAPPPPAIVLITIDTLRADHVGAYGYQRPTTPSIDALAERGVLFEEALTLIPTTGPSHASMLTGKEPADLGLRWNGSRLGEAEVTLAELLRGAGYKTAAVVAAAPLRSQAAGLDAGFDVYDEEFEGESRGADEVTEAAVAWLRGAGREGRFFLWIHYFDPHGPYVLHRQHLEALSAAGPWEHPKIRAYDTEIRRVDDAIGRLLGELDRLGRLDPAAVVVTADHGETLLERERGRFDHGDLYESCLRVPLVVKLPYQRHGQRVAAGRVVRLTDLFPTLLELAHLEAPPSDGCSLLALLDPDRASGWSCGKVVRVESHLRVGVHVDEGDVSSHWGVRAGSWKLILDNFGGRQLYDLGTDPGETRNLAGGAPAGIEESLERHLNQWLAERIERPGAPEDDLLPEIREQLRALGYL